MCNVDALHAEAQSGRGGLRSRSSRLGRKQQWPACHRTAVAPMSTVAMDGRQSTVTKQPDMY